MAVKYRKRLSNEDIKFDPQYVHLGAIETPLALGGRFRLMTGRDVVHLSGL